MAYVIITPTLACAPTMYAACAGSIPKELGLLSMLDQISFSSNKLTGEYNVFVPLILPHICDHRKCQSRAYWTIFLFLFLWRNDNIIHVY